MTSVIFGNLIQPGGAAFTLEIGSGAARDLSKIRHAKELTTVVETIAQLVIDPYTGSVLEQENGVTRRKHAGAFRLKYLVDAEGRRITVTGIPRRPKA